ncbi:hypothetical protein [Nocardioides ungokensis]|uniref:hypothetical protein n=1 Tax=Nocardioides ungokensis TaxID=1643322 RepID=UPI0015E00E1F|nr:hypothetical protein [Nocardioides ungokensis]
MTDSAPTATVRVVKRKWDGAVSALDTASPLAVPGEPSAWLVRTGSRRERPRSGAIEVVGSDELWVAVPGEWWVLCGYLDVSRSLCGYKVHAAAAFEAPRGTAEIGWVDLDLDLEISSDDLALRDASQFHERAHTMGYPGHIVSGAWSGIATAAARYTNADWPFDGSLQRWVDGTQS